jgi:hypothetical protein
MHPPKELKVKEEDICKSRFNHYKHFNLLQIKAVVFLRFGSLEDFTKRHMTFPEIAAYLKLKESRLRMLIKKFRDGGYQFN